jgi:glc operon protein GlcG
VSSAGSGVATHDFADFLAGNPVMLATMSTQPNVCLLPGGLPRLIDGLLAGAIGVAGAPGDIEQQIGRAGAAALIVS